MFYVFPGDPPPNQLANARGRAIALYSDKGFVHIVPPCLRFMCLRGIRHATNEPMHIHSTFISSEDTDNNCNTRKRNDDCLWFRWHRTHTGTPNTNRRCGQAFVIIIVTIRSAKCGARAPGKPGTRKAARKPVTRATARGQPVILGTPHVEQQCFTCSRAILHPTSWPMHGAVPLPCAATRALYILCHYACVLCVYGRSAMQPISQCTFIPHSFRQRTRTTTAIQVNGYRAYAATAVCLGSSGSISSS